MLMPTWMVIADALYGYPGHERYRARPFTAKAARFDGRTVGRNLDRCRVRVAAGERGLEIAAPIERRRANSFVAVLAESNLAQIRVHERRAMERSRDPGLNCPGHSLCVGELPRTLEHDVAAARGFDAVGRIARFRFVLRMHETADVHARRQRRPIVRHEILRMIPAALTQRRILFHRLQLEERAIEVDDRQPIRAEAGHLGRSLRRRRRWRRDDGRNLRYDRRRGRRRRRVMRCSYGAARTRPDGNGVGMNVAIGSGVGKLALALKDVSEVCAAVKLHA